MEIEPLDLSQFNFCEKDFQELPHILLTEKSSLPKESAIYFVFDEARKMWYVGQTQNIRRRWAGHARKAQLIKLGAVHLYWLPVKPTHLLFEMEQAFIRRFTPPLNIAPLRF